MSGGGKGGTQTTTQVNTPPAFVTEAQKNLQDKGNQILSGFLQNQPQYGVAGFGPDQVQAFDYARYLADQQMNATPVSMPATAQQGTVSHATAAQLDPGDINKFMNPYIQGAIDPTLANMQRQYQQSQADIGTKYAASGAFGGSGEALARGQASRAMGDQVASTVGNMMNTGWNSAAGLANNNTDRQQQTNIFNAGADNTMSQFNAGQGNSYALQGSQQDFQRKQAALQALLGTGTQQQQTAQQAIQYPMTALQMLSGITPGNTGGTQTTTAPNNSPSPIMQLLGLGLTAAPKILPFL